MKSKSRAILKFPKQVALLLSTIVLPGLLTGSSTGCNDEPPGGCCYLACLSGRRAHEGARDMALADCEAIANEYCNGNVSKLELVPGEPQCGAYPEWFVDLGKSK